MNLIVINLYIINIYKNILFILFYNILFILFFILFMDSFIKVVGGITSWISKLLLHV